VPSEETPVKFGHPRAEFVAREVEKAGGFPLEASSARIPAEVGRTEIEKERSGGENEEEVEGEEGFSRVFSVLGRKSRPGGFWRRGADLDVQSGRTKCLGHSVLFLFVSLLVRG